MGHYTTIFNQMLQLIPRHRFDALVSSLSDPNKRLLIMRPVCFSISFIIASLVFIARIVFVDKEPLGRPPSLPTSLANSDDMCLAINLLNKPN